MYLRQLLDYIDGPRFPADFDPVAAEVIGRPAGAFAQVQGSLSWFVDSFSTLADWKAVVDRLTTFADAMAATKVDQVQGLTVKTTEQPGLELDQVSVALPNGDLLLEDVDVVVRPGDRVVIQGPSGSGSSIRASRTSMPSCRARKTISGLESRPVILASGLASSRRRDVSPVPIPRSRALAGGNGTAATAASWRASKFGTSARIISR